MESNAADTSHCNYSEGHCLLKDQSYLLWDVNSEERCKYTAWKSLHGDIWGNNWISDDGTLALTMHGQRSVVNCGGQRLVLSDQGLAYEYKTFKLANQQSALVNAISHKLHDSHDEHRRQRRNVGQETAAELDATVSNGIVTSDVLAASLQALQMDISTWTKQSIYRALHAACRSMRTTVLLMQAEILANPTLAVRTLLGNQHIIATAGGNILETYPCHALPSAGYKILPQAGDVCYDDIPIEFSLVNSTHRGFLDPNTNIIGFNGRIGDCGKTKPMPVRLGDSSYLYSPADGSLQPIQRTELLQVPGWNLNASLTFADPPTIFHQIVMYNWSELQTHITMNDILSQFSRHQHMLNYFSSTASTTHSSEATDKFANNIVRRGLFGFMTDLAIDPVQLWIFCVCIYVTAAVIMLHCGPKP